MTCFSIINIFVLVFVVTIYGQENTYEASVRDEWYKYKSAYTDLPRYFNGIEGCPHEAFYLDCNRCWCGFGGKHAACTLIGCPSPPQIVNWSPGKQCPAGQQFYSKCNTCHCNEDGINAECTEKDCPDLSVKA